MASAFRGAIQLLPCGGTDVEPDGVSASAVGPKLSTSSAAAPSDAAPAVARGAGCSPQEQEERVMDLERSVRQILDREAVTALVHDYCRRFDENRPQDVAARALARSVVAELPEGPARSALSSLTDFVLARTG